MVRFATKDERLVPWDNLEKNQKKFSKTKLFIIENKQENVSFHKKSKKKAFEMTSQSPSNICNSLWSREDRNGRRSQAGAE